MFFCKIAETTGQPIHEVEELDLHYIDMWMSYFGESPALKDHINVCMAQVTQMIANTNRGSKKAAYEIDKFIIDYKKGDRPTRAQVRRKVDMMLR